MLQIIRSAYFVAGVALLAACGGGEQVGPTLAMTKASPSGDGQCAAAGSPLAAPFRVRVFDGGSPVAGITVTWTVSGGGSVNPSTSQSGSDGIAATTLTLPIGVAGPTTVQASSPGLGALTFTAGVPAGQAGVQVANNSFNPESTCLTAGGIVTFTWGTGAVGHNVTPAGIIPISQGHPALLNAPQSFPQVFPTAGTFVYFCSAHGTAQAGMRGTVTVVP